jgi:hypothetical protein
MAIATLSRPILVSAIVGGNRPDLLPSTLWAGSGILHLSSNGCLPTGGVISSRRVVICRRHFRWKFRRATAGCQSTRKVFLAETQRAPVSRTRGGSEWFPSLLLTISGQLWSESVSVRVLCAAPPVPPRRNWRLSLRRLGDPTMQSRPRGLTRTRFRSFPERSYGDGYVVGLMFWFRRKKLVGSYFFLRATSRA